MTKSSDMQLEQRLVLRLLEEFSLDENADGIQPLEHYLTAHLGHEALVEREYASFVDQANEVDSDTRQFGQYRLESLLGQGAQGSVYLARDERLDRCVALKVLSGLAFESASCGPPSLLAREVEALTRLDHPGIAGVFEAGVEAGHAFVAMRYVDGPSLAQTLSAWRAGSAPPLAERIELGTRLAEALGAAHTAGVVHRDVKPSNVVLDSSGAPVLIDFGLARTVDSGVFDRTRTGDLVGTPRYMAPERLAGLGGDDPRGDVWSLGVVLYELATLELPFDGPTVEAIARRIEREEPPPLRRTMGRSTLVLRDLEGILSVALEKRISRRYRDAAALAADLRRLQHGQPIDARPPGPVGRGLRWLRRHPALATIFVLLALIASGSAAVSWRLSKAMQTERRAHLEALAGVARADADRAQLLLASGARGRFGAAAEHLAAVGAKFTELASAKAVGLDLPRLLDLRRDAARALTSLGLAPLETAPFGGLGDVRTDPAGEVLAALAISSENGWVELNLGNAMGAVLPPIDTEEIPSPFKLLAVAPGGKAVLLTSNEGAWLARTERSVERLELPAELGVAKTGRFSPDGTQLSIQGEHRWALIELDGHEVVHAGELQAAPAPKTAFTKDGFWLGMGTEEGLVLAETHGTQLSPIELDGEVLALGPFEHLGAPAGTPPHVLAVRQLAGRLEVLVIDDGAQPKIVASLVGALLPLPVVAIDSTATLGAVAAGGQLLLVDLVQAELVHQSALRSPNAVEAFALRRGVDGPELLLSHRGERLERLALTRALELLEPSLEPLPVPTALLEVRNEGLPAGASPETALPNTSMVFRDEPELALRLGLPGILLHTGLASARESAAPGASPPRAAAWLIIVAEGELASRAAVWQKGRAEPLLAVEVPTLTSGGAVALNADGTQLAIHEPSGRLRVYQVASGTLLFDLELPARDPLALAFREDGDLILLGERGGPRRLRLGRLGDELERLGLGL